MLAESVARSDEPLQLLDAPTAPSRPSRDLLVATPYLFWKRGFEIFLALALSLVAGPLILLCILAVKLTSRGPIFYSQIRVGRSGRPFRIWKIRTMITDAEAAGARWCVPGDPRVTPVGRFLRNTHLDELPQLWNVLRGDMSLFGPRPERPEFVPQLEKEIPRYRDRLVVRPGLTGLAQVQLPPDTDLDSVRRKLACDLYYVQHVSFWLDLRLILTTAFYLLNLSTTWPCRVLRIPGGEPVQQAYQQLIAGREEPKDAS